MFNIGMEAQQVRLYECPPMQEKPHILVVDKRSDICDMLYQALTMAGYRVTTFARGEAWIDYAVQSHNSPALVLLDLSQPSLDAVRFLHDLRARWLAAPPILVMTTSEYIYSSLTAVEEYVLQKPFHLANLLKTIAAELRS